MILNRGIAFEHIDANILKDIYILYYSGHVTMKLTNQQYKNYNQKVN
jgi:hypothetical protein